MTDLFPCYIPRPASALRGKPLAAVLVVLLLSSAACSAPPPPAPTAGPSVPASPTRTERKPDPTIRLDDGADGRPDLSAYTDEEEEVIPTASASELRKRASSAEDLRWLPALRAVQTLLPGLSPTRTLLLLEKQRALAAGDSAGQARVNAVLAAEAFTRGSPVVRRWLDRRDPATGLFANRSEEEDADGWYYRNTGADLYPHIAIGTRILFPDRYPEAVAGLTAERRLAPSGLPDDLLLPNARRAGRSAEDRMFGAAEYAKDGLLPLLERLGPDPWLGRLTELADAMLVAAATPTRRGPIPANSNEVNGDALQVLTRVYWATGDDRYVRMADRIGRAYLEDMLPKTDWLPAHEWDFVEGEPIGDRRLRLSDHGNEIVAGLVTWHLLESQRDAPDAPAHRATLRRMLDRILAKGRNPAGLWYRVLEIPSGKVDQDGLSDNWAYLVQAYLAHATLERTVPGGEVARAERYEQAARDSLRALPKYAYYPWQRGVMDGYADTLEGVLYLLPRLPDAAAARWVDEQIAVLYGFQDPAGAVEDNYLDGNFVRTTLMYALSLTAGVWPEPWRPDLAVGAAADGPCLQLAVASADAWDGRLHFDTPRHGTNTRLPTNFPRINEWPESFTVEPGKSYALAEPGTEPRRVDGALLTAGLPLHLEPTSARSLQICPVT